MAHLCLCVYISENTLGLFASCIFFFLFTFFDCCVFVQTVHMGLGSFLIGCLSPQWRKTHTIQKKKIKLCIKGKILWYFGTLVYIISNFQWSNFYIQDWSNGGPINKSYLSSLSDTLIVWILHLLHQYHFDYLHLPCKGDMLESFDLWQWFLYSDPQSDPWDKYEGTQDDFIDNWQNYVHFSVSIPSFKFACLGVKKSFKWSNIKT